MKMKNKISVFVAAILIVGAVSVSCERRLTDHLLAKWIRLKY